jgi:hypothetical protein
MIIHILILAFICLIIYQLFTLNIIEGLDDPSISPEPEPEPEPEPKPTPKPVSVPDSSEAGSSTSTPAPISTPANVVATPKSYQPYDSSNALILSQQNAGNISILNQQLNTLTSEFNKTQTQSNKNTTDITSLNDQMASISAAQTKYATSTTAAFTPPP